MHFPTEIMSSGGKNIILDLDGTLIDAQSAVGACSALVLGRGPPAHVCGGKLGRLRVYKRPGLDTFIDWCFLNFDNVGIWTLSGKEWLDEVLDNVLTQFPREKWSLLWTGERATRLRDNTDQAITVSGVSVIKDLKKIFRNKTLRRQGFTRWNTVIVEDNPSNCIRNYGNAIYMTPFDILGNRTDNELLHLQKYLQNIVLPCVNIRALDKRDWIQEMLIEEKRSLLSKKSEAGAFWMSDAWKTNLVGIAKRSIKF